MAGFPAGAEKHYLFAFKQMNITRAHIFDISSEYIRDKPSYLSRLTRLKNKRMSTVFIVYFNDIARLGHSILFLHRILYVAL